LTLKLRLFTVESSSWNGLKTLLNCIFEVTAMNKLAKTGLIAFVCCAASVALATRSANAQWGGGCGGWGYDGYYSGYAFGYQGDHIPYFSLHPPVYYSRIVPRAMGWTPFAYSPDAIVLPLDDGGPEQIINPYVPPINKAVPAPPSPGTKAKSSANKTASNADLIKVIVNPYVGTTLADRDD
jgi:hypothetical protein